MPPLPTLYALYAQYDHYANYARTRLFARDSTLVALRLKNFTSRTSPARETHPAIAQLRSCAIQLAQWASMRVPCVRTPLG